MTPLPLLSSNLERNKTQLVWCLERSRAVGDKGLLWPECCVDIIVLIILFHILGFKGHQHHRLAAFCPGSLGNCSHCLTKKKAAHLNLSSCGIAWLWPADFRLDSAYEIQHFSNLNAWTQCCSLPGQCLLMAITAPGAVPFSFSPLQASAIRAWEKFARCWVNYC